MEDVRLVNKKRFQSPTGMSKTMYNLLYGGMTSPKANCEKCGGKNTLGGFGMGWITTCQECGHKDMGID